MRVQSSNLVQLASLVYNQIPALKTAPAPAAPAILEKPAACMAHLRNLAQDERVKGVGAVISVAETPFVVRLLGGLADVRKGVALAAPLEGLALTPRGVETLVNGRPQGIAPIPLFDTFADPAAFYSALDKQLTALYEDCRKLRVQYFAPKNALAAMLMRTPEEM